MLHSNVPSYRKIWRTRLRTFITVVEYGIGTLSPLIFMCDKDSDHFSHGYCFAKAVFRAINVGHVYIYIRNGR